MTKIKKDIIQGEQFTKLSHPKKNKRVASSKIGNLEDENKNTLEETLIGMEYDLEDPSDEWDEDEEEDFEREESTNL